MATEPPPWTLERSSKPITTGSTDPNLLAVLPTADRLIEVGCSTGAMARAYRDRHPRAHWLGIEIDPSYAELARQHCQQVLVGDVEDLIDDPAVAPLLQAQCWVFGDSLEHLRDPWQLLRKVHRLLPEGGVVCACIPNAQHWSLQARLCLGEFIYEDSGLLDRTHLRWFTPTTMANLFQDNGFRIVSWQPRVFNHQAESLVLEHIRAFATSLGGDPEQAVNDARPLQMAIRAERQ